MSRAGSNHSGDSNKSPEQSGAGRIYLTSRKTACENSKWTVCFDEIAGPKGRSVSNYIVLIPKIRAARNITGVCVLPILESGEVLLLRAYRHPLEGHFWEGARGFIDPEETPEAAAARELREETGLACPPGSLVSLGFVTPEASTLVARVALYAAFSCRPVDVPVDDELGLGVAHRFESKEALRMAQDGRIEDATTLISLYRYASLARAANP
jgi:ADP-ribose diphosphatase